MTDAARLLFAGDISLSGEYVSRFGGGRPRWSEPFRRIREVIQGVDLAIGNLESPLLTSATPRDKRNLLGAPPESVAALDFLGFSAVGLGNNHIADQGIEGIEATRAVLEDAGIAGYGAGGTLADAGRPALLSARGMQFAFHAYVAQDEEEVGAEIATATRGGCVPLFLERVAGDIEAARRKASHVVVSLHWGYQYDRYPSPEQVAIAHRIIDMGALIVHGHHPHVPQAVEAYRNGLIMYSLGNFYFPDFTRTDGRKYRFPAEARETMVVVCEVDDRGVQGVDTIPVALDSRDRMRPLQGATAARWSRSQAALAKAVTRPDYDEVWANHHRDTQRWRRTRLEEPMRLQADARKMWDRVLARGPLESFGRLRPRHLPSLFKLLGQPLSLIRHRKRTRR